MREDILEGLKIAVSKGESLQQAMQSFFNAGYKKEEIEEAARALQMFQAGQPIPQTTQPIKPKQSAPQQTSQPIQKLGRFQELKQKLIQKISDKKQTPQQFQKPQPHKLQEKEKPQKLLIILLGLVLFVLLAALIGVFLFKDQIVNLFR